MPKLITARTNESVIIQADHSELLGYHIYRLCNAHIRVCPGERGAAHYGVSEDCNDFKPLLRLPRHQKGQYL